MATLLSTTGTLDPVVINDLGGKTLSHPTVDFDLEIEYTVEQIQGSTDLQTLVDDEHITLTDGEGNTIGNISQTATHTHTESDIVDLHESKEEQITSENIGGADLVMTQKLSFKPVGDDIELRLNGVIQTQGIAKDYTINIGLKEITWLSNSGTAVDMATTDELIIKYKHKNEI